MAKYLAFLLLFLLSTSAYSKNPDSLKNIVIKSITKYLDKPYENFKLIGDLLGKKPLPAEIRESISETLNENERLKLLLALTAYKNHFEPKEKTSNPASSSQHGQATHEAGVTEDCEILPEASGKRKNTEEEILGAPAAKVIRSDFASPGASTVKNIQALIDTFPHQSHTFNKDTCQFLFHPNLAPLISELFEEINTSFCQPKVGLKEVKLLTQNKNLKKLGIGRLNLDIAEYLGTLNHLTRVEDLHGLMHPSKGERGVKAVEAIIKNNPLEEIFLNDNFWDESENEREKWSSILANKSTLNSIVSQDENTNLDLISLGKILRKHGHIQRLALTREDDPQPYQIPGNADPFEFLDQNQLKTLKLTLLSQWDDSLWNHLFTHLKRNTSINGFIVEKDEPFTEEVQAKIRDSLKAHPSLTKLKLTMNESEWKDEEESDPLVTAENLVPILESANLESVILDFNSFSDADGEKIVQALKKKNTVRELSLAGSLFTPGMLSVIAKNLSSLHLKSLNLREIAFKVVHLTQFFKELPELDDKISLRIDLSKVEKASAEQVEEFFRALGAQKAISKLILYPKSLVTPERLEQLKTANPGLMVGY